MPFFVFGIFTTYLPFYMPFLIFVANFINFGSFFENFRKLEKNLNFGRMIKVKISVKIKKMINHIPYPVKFAFKIFLKNQKDQKLFFIRQILVLL